MAFAYIKARTLGLQIIFKKQNEITTGILIFQNIFFFHISNGYVFCVILSHSYFDVIGGGLGYSKIVLKSFLELILDTKKPQFRVP